MNSIGSRAIAGLFYGSAGLLVQALLQIATLVVLARLLSPADFGIVGAALVVAKLATVFSQFGVAPAVVQRETLTKNHICAAFGVSAGLGALFTMGVIFSSQHIASFFRIEGLHAVLRWYAFMFLLRGLSVIAEALLQRDLKFKELMMSEIASYAFGYGLFGIYLAANGYGYWALVWAHLMQALIKTVVLIGLRPHPRSFVIDMCALRDLLRFGAGQTLSRIANYAANEGDKAVVAKVLGAEALGEYGRANQLVIMPVTLFGGVVDTVLFPTLARIQSDGERLRLNFRRGITLLTLINFPFGCVLVVVAEPLVSLVLGPKWAGVAPIIQVLAVSLVFRGAAKISDSLAKSKGAVYWRASIQWAYALTVCVGAYFASPYGVVWVAVAVVVAGLLQAILMIALGVHLTAIARRQIVGALIPGIVVGCLAGATASFVHGVFLRFQFSPALDIILTTGSAAFIYLLVITFRRGKMIGKDGAWIGELLARTIANRRRLK